MESLVNPETLSIELSLIISFLLVAYLWASIRLGSAITAFSWMITVVMLMIIFVTDLSFMFFWLMVILTSVSIAVSIIVYFVFEDRI